MTTRGGKPLELRPFSGSTLPDVLNYLKRDLARAFADLFAIIASDNRLQTEVYVPNVSAGTNVDAVNPLKTSAMRVMDMVVVSGVVYVDTAATGNFDFLMQLPFASRFQAEEDLGGAAGVQNGSTDVFIYADTVNGAAKFQGSIGTASESTLPFIFMYRIR